MEGTKPSWDVFCRVVDNYGDAAVCWRLAQDLARDHGTVRLFIDKPVALQALRPEFDATLEAQTVVGVDVRRWDESTAWGMPADILVEGFGCGTPGTYLEVKGNAKPGSLWIVLEYLSAEAWVADRHGLPSPPPRLPLERYFYFPGFTEMSGGLLREAGYDVRARAFADDPSARGRLWRRLGFDAPTGGQTVVSVFAYENRAVAPLFDVWAEGDRPVVAAVPNGRVRPGVTEWLGEEGGTDGAVFRRGSLEVRYIPFQSQPDYDELLWACDWNFVRGEDSFVRAQWAARPFVWQPYPQDEGADNVKQDAFLALYAESFASDESLALRALWRGWSGFDPQVLSQLGEVWRLLVSRRDRLERNAREWADRMEKLGDLARNLAEFCRKR